jgi:hypothetical protein
MKSITLKIAIGYTLWTILWIGLTIFGNSENGVSAFFYLTITGLPFSLLGWNIQPNGGVLSLVVVGAIGTLQWVLLSVWWKSKK